MRASEDQGGATATVETVLVVEDQVLVRLALAAYLRDCGYRVLEAANANEAMVLIEQDEDGAIGVVLSDVEMAGGPDGFALAQWIRRQRPGCEVILAGTIARAAEAAGEICQQGPMLAKPYEPQVVLDRIRRLLAQRLRRPT